MVNVVPREVPRHNIHHDTSSAFSNNVPLYLARPPKNFGSGWAAYESYIQGEVGTSPCWQVGGSYGSWLEMRQECRR